MTLPTSNGPAFRNWVEFMESKGFRVTIFGILMRTRRHFLQVAMAKAKCGPSGEEPLISPALIERRSSSLYPRDRFEVDSVSEIPETVGYCSECGSQNCHGKIGCRSLAKHTIWRKPTLNRTA